MKVSVRENRVIIEGEADNREYRKELPFEDNRTAQKKAREIRKKLKEREKPEGAGPEIPTFEMYSHIWLSDKKKIVRDSTFERYQGLLNRYIIPEVGKKQADEFTRGDIRSLLMKYYKAGQSKSSISLIKDVLSGVFEYAIDDEIIDSNPTKGILKRIGLKTANTVDTMQIFNRDEVDQFLSVCDNPDQFGFFLTAFRTGMRKGELLALEWADIDFRCQWIQVSRSCRRGKISKTKTGKTRYTDMSAQLAATLAELFEKRRQEALNTGKRKPLKIVFHRKGKNPGRYIAESTLEKQFRRLLKKAGLRKIRFHDIRHTYASLLLSSNASPVYVKEQMGHSSIRMTVDRYGHWIPGNSERFVDLLDSQALKT
ncbi:site-specific integrase [Desulfococcaceae bacterium HSG8]|nr:site-specific integrase [Desulfococcaceae bacterium HSG8]